MLIRALIMASCLLVGASCALAQIDQISRGLGHPGKQSGLSDVKIGEGLKEALQVSTENAVNLTGRTDGYFLNSAIKILMPEKLRLHGRGELRV